MLEEFYKNKKTILKKSQEIFFNSNSLIPKVGIELEFFLLKRNSEIIEDRDFFVNLITILKTELIKKFSLINQVEKERAVSQIEIKTDFTSDLVELGNELEKAKNFVKNFAEEKNLIASFVAQPFADDCGSALQFNISLHDQNNKNLFESDEKFLKKIAVGLLEATDFMMIFLAPKTEDYLRFSYELNRNLFKNGKFSAPINLSLGTDNRTCAIRIPTVKNLANSNYGKRIEYRVATADADFFLVTSAILSAIMFKIKNIDQPEKLGFQQIFGNAFDQQYQLKNFCRDLKQSSEFFLKEENFIRKQLESFIG